MIAQLKELLRHTYMSTSVVMEIQLHPFMQGTWDTLDLVFWAARQYGRNTEVIVSR